MRPAHHQSCEIVGTAELLETLLLAQLNLELTPAEESLYEAARSRLHRVVYDGTNGAVSVALGRLVIRSEVFRRLSCVPAGDHCIHADNDFAVFET